MTVSIESPPHSQIYNTDPHSPPPTPRKHRLLEVKEDIPLFFPCSQSVLGESVTIGPVMDDESQLFHVLSTTIRLKPKPLYGTKISRDSDGMNVTRMSSLSLQATPKSLQEMAHLLPPPPLVSNSATVVKQTELAPSTSSMMSSHRFQKKASSSPSESSKSGKLEPIQRAGMRRNVDRRNSMVARCA
jgi:hypothetical protein